MDNRLHDNEIAIGVDLVRKLVDAQFPEYASLSLRRLDASGSTNALFQLGEDLLARLPRQPGGGAALHKEQQWLPRIARHLPVDVPEIVALGEPAFGFEEFWSIVRWLPGTQLTCVQDGCPSPARDELAHDLADVILALRSVDVPAKALSDPSLQWYRGRPLAEFDRHVRSNIEQCRSIKGIDLDLEAAIKIWQQSLSLPRRSTSDCWYHSDLVAENLLLSNDCLTGVIDFGGLGVGDPTVDLHGAWEVLDPTARKIFRERLAIDDAEWMRGRAWALAISISALTYYWEKMPDRCQDRLVMARAVIADARV